MDDIERYYRGGQDVIRDWMDDNKDSPDYLQQVQDMGTRIYGDLQEALTENGDPLWIARCRGELSCLD